MDPVTAGAVGFLAGLTFWGWAILILECIILFPLAIYARNEVAFISLVIFGIAAYFIMGWNIPEAIWNHPGQTILYLAAYFAIGAVWSVYRWYRFVAERRRLFDDAKAKFIAKVKIVLAEAEKTHPSVGPGMFGPLGKAQQLPPDDKKAAIAALERGEIPDLLLGFWNDDAHYDNEHGIRANVIPSPLQSKREITSWIAFWPWSFLWHMIGEVFTDFVNWIYRRLANVYVSITRRQFNGVDPRLLKKSDR